LTYGRPRRGHHEGSVGNHLKDLDANLERLKPLVSQEEYWKLKVLIHVHDTFKIHAKRDSAIEDPQSHASLARQFLAEYSDDSDLLNMVQYHDEGYAIWKEVERKGSWSIERFTRNVIDKIRDIDLFLLFTLIDGFTPSKEHTRIRWFADQVNQYRPVKQIYRALELFGI
jgi:hypothetical protein